MNWFLYSIISVFAYTGMMIIFKKLQQTYKVEVYLFIISVGSFLLLIPFVSFSKFNFSFTTIILATVASIGSLLGNYVYNLSMTSQSNIGLIDAISKGVNIALNYMAALLLFGAITDFSHLLGMALILIAIIIVNNRKSINFDVNNKNVIKYSWYFLAISSGSLFAFSSIINKAVFNIGLLPITAFFISKGVASLGYWKLVGNTGSKIRVSNHLHWLFIGAILNVLGGLTFFWAIQLAENVAYPVVIGASRMILLFIIYSCFSKDEKRRGTLELISVVLTFLGVILLSQGY